MGSCENDIFLVVYGSTKPLAIKAKTKKMKTRMIGKRVEFLFSDDPRDKDTLQGFVLDKNRDSKGVDYYLVELDNGNVEIVYPPKIIKTA